MKTRLKISTAIVAVGALILGCEDLQKVTPVPNTSSSNLSANMIFVNASPDAPALSFYVNNIKVESGVAPGGSSAAYWNLPITLNGVTSNTSIHALGPNTGIGGTLNNNYLVFRAGATNTNNFQAADKAYYTVIVLDSIKRPKPLRTVNSLGFGDITYYAPAKKVTGKSLANVDTVINLSPDYNNSVKTYNFCLSRQVPSSFFTPLGVSSNPAVPLGCTDPGGPRFLIVSDYMPLPATSPVWPAPAAGKFTARFINASPDAGNATCKINTVSTTGTYPLLATSNYTPAVGSRTTTGTTPTVTVPFSITTTSGVPYSVSITGGFTTVTTPAITFADQGVYTVILTGSKLKNNLGATVIRNK